MQIIQAPNLIPVPIDPDSPLLFLAGGISNCPDWQKELCDSLSQYEGECYIINPRRVGDLARTGEDAKIQIKWEIDMIHESSYFIFWFPEESICPITLFELGKITEMLAGDNFIYGETQICVGIHPNYQRKMDLEIQLPAILPEIEIVNSLEEIRQWIIELFDMKLKEN